MVKMAGQQQQPHSSRYPNLSVTVKHDGKERSIDETYTNSRTRRSKDNYRPSSFQPRNVYYNSNHRYQQQPQQQQYLTRPPHTSPRRQQQSYYANYDHLHYHYQQQQQQPIRPLMEIKDNLFLLHHDSDDNNDDNDLSYRMFKQKEPKQRGQYRNRKAELDWDHAFDLDLIDLYPTYNDIDTRSLLSTISSSDHSFSSI